MNDTPEPRQTPRTPGGPYLLTPVPSQHVEESRALILDAAGKVRPGRVVVLGAGNCAEIPLAELVARFEHVTLNDVNGQLLEGAVAAAALDEQARAKVDLHVADLTGVTETLVEKISTALATIEDPQAAVAVMARLVDAEQVAPLPISGQFDLVVASCLLSQLHFDLVHRCAERFASRYPGRGDQLAGSSLWTTAMFGMARRMEAALIDGIAALVAHGGLVYLSESPQMCYIQLTEAGAWETAGTFRMLRSAEIDDYVDERFAIVTRRRWHWVVAPPQQPGQVGRLFDVQALVLRMA